MKEYCNFIESEVEEINSIKIQPLSSKKENLFLSLVVIVIVVIAYFLIQLTSKKDIGQTLTATQISAYKELSNVNNSFYTELTNSLLEIEALAEMEGEIPEIAVLEKEEISPYLKDDLWEERGALTWKKLEVKGKVYYLGISKQVNIVGNYLIEFNQEAMDKSVIYYNDEQDDGRSLPKSISHLQEHWKEIVPYTGTEEREKF